MNRQVTHDGTAALEIRFPYDRDLVEQIKSLPRRRWDATDRFWSVPETDVVPLVDLLAVRGFEFDRATRDLYASMGGTRTLADSICREAHRDPRPSGLGCAANRTAGRHAGARTLPHRGGDTRPLDATA